MSKLWFQTSDETILETSNTWRFAPHIERYSYLTSVLLLRSLWFKVKNNLTPKPFQDIFVMKERGSNDFVIPRINTVKMGEGSVRYRGPKTWEIVPGEIKQSKSLDIFKNRIKEWRPVDCTCSLCETYVEGVGHGFFKEGSFVPK